MQKKLMSCSLALLFIFTAHAAIRSGYRDWRPQNSEGAGYVLADATFPAGNNGWSNIDGRNIQVEPNGGVNGSPALRYERTDPESYTLVSRQLTLEAGRTYRFGAVIRNEGIQGQGGNVIIEFYDAAGNYRRNVECPTSATGDCDWTELEYSVTVAPEEAVDSVFIHLLMPRGSTGVTRFDRVFIEESAPRWQFDQCYPTHQIIDAAGGPFRLYCQLHGKFRLPEDATATPAYEAELTLLLPDGERQCIAPADSAILAVDFGPLPAGTGQLRSRLYDTANQVLLAEQQRPITIRDRRTDTDGNACLIDEKGRAIVNGKPYLPIGLYTGIVTREDVDRIAASPFNCIMSYGSMEQDFNWSRATPLAELPGRVREAMDYMAQKGLKVIFSLKDVYRSNPLGADDYSFKGMQGADAVTEFYIREFKDHPALLAWYICDERMVDWLPLMTARRQMVNRLDPNHPTWGVFYQPNVADYLPMLDIFGGDQYPISRISEGYDHHMTSIDRLMGYAEATGIPTWNVPQAHNLNIYAPRSTAADYRDPTADEILALSLVQAIHGGKGFVFYSYFDLGRGPQDSDAPELFEARWQAACTAAAELEKLAPFLLSDAAELPVVLENVTGKVRARCFADGNGNYRLLLAGVGPGESAATIRIPGLPEGVEFTSRSGLTVREATGEFVFRGTDIIYDIVGLNAMER